MRDVDEMRRSFGKGFDIPFNSKNKYQVHVHCGTADPENDYKDRTIYMKGAPERIIDRCTQYLTGDGKIVDFSADLKASVEQAQMAMGNNGLRVLGFCTKTLPRGRNRWLQETCGDKTPFAVGMLTGL